MFDLYFLNSRNNWEIYCTQENIKNIYKVILDLNNGGVITFYRIDVDGRVFTYLDNSEYKLNYMMEHFDTNEKCKPRFTCDEYETSYIKTKKKGRR